MRHAEIGPCTSGETTLARPLLRLLKKGMLLLVDRGFPGYELWREAAATGSELCWRTKSNAVLAVTTALPDGSYLSALQPPRGNPGSPITVRVVEYTLTHPSRAGDEGPIRLITTLLDPTEAPALELAALYAERWAIVMWLARCLMGLDVSSWSRSYVPRVSHRRDRSRGVCRRRIPFDQPGRMMSPVTCAGPDSAEGCLRPVHMRSRRVRA